MESTEMSAEAVCIELAEMESAILEKGNEISIEEASTCHKGLLSLYRGFTKSSPHSFSFGYTYSEKFCNIACFVQKKVLHIEKILLRFFSPDYTISSTASEAKMINDQHQPAATFCDLASLVHKQKFYMKMIDLLEPTGDLKLKEAEVHSEHLNQYHKKFISNQSEIIALIDCKSSSSFNEQAEISLKVQQKVRKIQAQLKEFSISASVVETPPPTPLSSTSSCDLKVNDQRTISDLTSLKRKQKFYIEMIDSLQPTDDLESKDAEVQSEHLDKYHEKFISNQCEITALIEDNSSLFNDQVTISSQVQQKVRKILTKLKETFAIETLSPAPPSTNSLLDEHFNQNKRLRIAADLLDQQMKRQKSLIDDIKLIESDLSQLYDAFVKNQLKIATSVRGATLDEQLRISDEILCKVKTLHVKLKEMLAPDVSPSADVSSAVELKL